MTSDDKIKTVLEWAKERYDNPCTGDIDEGRLYSKLAILELSGWVEGSLKDILLKLVDKKLNDDKATKKFKKVIEKTRGFRYEDHFLNLLNKTVGFINKEVIEREINGKDCNKLQKFKNALNNLSERRNMHAHNFSYKPQKIFTMSDPSSMINCYENILPGLEAFKEEIAKNQGISF